MEASPAQSIILGTMAITIIDATIGNLESSKARVPASRILIGGYLVTMVLLVGSEVSPSVAEGMSILIMLGSLFGPNGGALTQLVSKLTTTNTLPKQPLTPVKGVS